jgi:hypothetical protein
LIKAISRPQSLQIQRFDKNHRKEEKTVGKEPEWKVQKQPAWLVAAIRKTIAALRRVRRSGGDSGRNPELTL